MSTTNNIPAGCLPFDLDKYKAGHPARTHDGKKVTFAAHSPTNPNKTTRIVSFLEDGCWLYHTESGRYFLGRETEDDIFLVAPTPTYTPWTSLDEVPDDAWFRDRFTNRVFRITEFDPVCASVRLACTWFTLEELFENFKHHPDRRHTGDWNVCGKLQNT